jgi:hypothetical protein
VLHFANVLPLRKGASPLDPVFLRVSCLLRVTEVHSDPRRTRGLAAGIEGEIEDLQTAEVEIKRVNVPPAPRATLCSDGANCLDNRERPLYLPPTSACPNARFFVRLPSILHTQKL